MEEDARKSNRFIFGLFNTEDPTVFVMVLHFLELSTGCSIEVYSSMMITAF